MKLVITHRRLTLMFVASLALVSVKAKAREVWPFDQRQILLVEIEGQKSPEAKVAAQIMDGFVRRGRVRWVTQKAGVGQLVPVQVPRDFPWQSASAVRQLGLRYKVDGIVALVQRGVLLEMRWYSSADGNPLMFETVNLPAAGPRPGEAEARQQRLANWIDEVWNRIPGRGYVVKRDMTTVTLEGARQENLKVGDKLELRRLLEIQRHPLLKTLVSIRSSVSGQATVQSIGDPFSIAKIDYESQTDPIQEGDRYQVANPSPMPGALAADSENPKVSADPAASNANAPVAVDAPAGKLAYVQARGLIGLFGYDEVAGGTTVSTSSTRFGVGVDGTLLLTPNWLLGLDAKLFFGTSAASDIAIGGGYRYIFIEDEGPIQGEVRGSLAYRRFSTGLDRAGAAIPPNDKLYTGFQFDVRLQMPITREFGAYVKGSRLLGTSLSEDPQTSGATSSSLLWSFEGGGMYVWAPDTILNASIGVISASSDYEGTGTRATSATSSTLRSTVFSVGYERRF